MKNTVQVKIIVLGASQVGKSALTVRYLTRRFIGEYKSHTDLSYRQVFSLDGNNMDVEIIDVSNQPEDTSIPIGRAKSCDACLIVYSISDRSSFWAASEALLGLQNNCQRSSERSVNKMAAAPIVLLGNKKDLDHLRQVETAEAKELARRTGCVFSEVSAAETETEPDISFIFNQLIREARARKLQLNNSSNSNNNGTNSNSSNNNILFANNQRQRKRTVFTINRMFGSLMGRNSMPPELPCQTSSSVSNFAASMPDVAGSFKSVFKKRSV